MGLTTSFGKSVRYEVLSFACLTVKKRVGYRAGSYVDVLSVSPFVSLTIAKFIRLCEHCFVVVLFSAMYVISCPYIIPRGRAT